jgi:predicted nucleic acid-binding protein
MAAFVDTNILIYALIADELESADKVNAARDLVSDLTRRGEIVISAQVLGEFSANAMRKGTPPLTMEQTRAHVAELRKQRVVAIDGSLVELALERMEASRISYWDALIVEAAVRSGASILYTEDLHSGTFYGGVEVRNPFL